MSNDGILVWHRPIGIVPERDVECRSLPADTSFFKQKTAYEIMSGDWSSDVCSSD
eukprot:COSAG01_NODE_65880_length_272_cov_0.554913_1_plen_54_part_01